MKPLGAVKSNHRVLSQVADLLYLFDIREGEGEGGRGRGGAN